MDHTAQDPASSLTEHLAAVREKLCEVQALAVVLAKAGETEDTEALDLTRYGGLIDRMIDDLLGDLDSVTLRPLLEAATEARHG